jgi:hypothetical protein
MQGINRKNNPIVMINNQDETINFLPQTTATASNQTASANTQPVANNYEEIPQGHNGGIPQGHNGGIPQGHNSGIPQGHNGGIPEGQEYVNIVNANNGVAPINTDRFLDNGDQHHKDHQKSNDNSNKVPEYINLNGNTEKESLLPSNSTSNTADSPQKEAYYHIWGDRAV